MEYVEESGKQMYVHSYRTIRWHSAKYIVDLVKYPKRNLGSILWRF